MDCVEFQTLKYGRQVGEAHPWMVDRFVQAVAQEQGIEPRSTT
jgi:hypothetical protein